MGGDRSCFDGRGAGWLCPADGADALRQLHGDHHRKGCNPIGGVEVVATNLDTQVTYTAKSNSDGLYTIPALPIGNYKVRAQAQGFQAYETNPIRLESGQNARVDITLQVGFEQSIEVTGVTPILQTQDAVVGDVVSGTTIEACLSTGATSRSSRC